MKKIMSRAHKIRKEAAAKWNCKVSEIVFSICLQIAHEENKMSEMRETHTYKSAKGATIKIERITVEKISNGFGGTLEKPANEIQITVNGKSFLLASLVEKKGFDHGLLRVDAGLIPLDGTARAIYDKHANLAKSNVASFAASEKEYQTGRKKVLKAMGQ